MPDLPEMVCPAPAVQPLPVSAMMLVTPLFNNTLLLASKIVWVMWQVMVVSAEQSRNAWLSKVVTVEGMVTLVSAEQP